MLVEKEVIRPGVYFYKDEQTGLPRKLTVTPELTRYWHDQGNAMLNSGLTVPVPIEHDFNAHPMTPVDRLKNNAGWVKHYSLKGDKLFSAVDIPDDELRKKLPHTIRWTSPWINSFTDGQGKDWKNVISHLALTTRPRIVAQAPFSGIAAALSMAIETPTDHLLGGAGDRPEGFCLSRAGRLFIGKVTNRLRPRYPMAFSLWGGGIKLAEEDMPPPKKKGSPKPGEKPGEGGEADDMGGDLPEDIAAEDAADNDAEPGDISDPLKDAGGDVAMEELLCDLLQALGVPMPDESNEAEFKRHLYEAAMSKIKELTSEGMGKQKDPMTDQNNPDKSHTSQPGQPNPLIQQEQQPMYMSLDEINKLPDPMKGVALAMYAENQKLRADLDAGKKITDSLRDAKLKEAAVTRNQRVALLGRLSPKVKADLDAMLASPSAALSMGDGGMVVDPMAHMLTVLEKGLSDMPRLLTADHAALAVQPQPTDGSMLSDTQSDDIADRLARQMGCPPKAKAS